MINKQKFEAKTVELCKELAFESLNCSANDLVFITVDEGSKGILGIGGKKAIVEAVMFKDIVEYGKVFLTEVLSYMSLNDVIIEVIKRDGYVNYKIYSENNGVLIGKNGRTLESLQFILKQAIQNNVGVYIGVTLDVGGYKDKRRNRLERLAHKVSRSVAKSKVEAKLDPMNAYERRLIHTYLVNDKFVYTTSEGVEPSRYVVIKPKK